MLLTLLTYDNDPIYLSYINDLFSVEQAEVLAKELNLERDLNLDIPSFLSKNRDILVETYYGISFMFSRKQEVEKVLKKLLFI